MLLSPKLTLVNPCDLKGRMLFAKTEQVELEQRLVGSINDLAKNNDHALVIKDQDIALVLTLHKAIDIEKIKKIKYVFDCTNKLNWAKNL